MLDHIGRLDGVLLVLNWLQVATQLVPFVCNLRWHFVACDCNDFQLGDFAIRAEHFLRQRDPRILVKQEHAGVGCWDLLLIQSVPEVDLRAFLAILCRLWLVAGSEACLCHLLDEHFLPKADLLILRQYLRLRNTILWLLPLDVAD